MRAFIAGITLLTLSTQFFILSNLIHMRSVTLEDLENYIKLFADGSVMMKYATGKPNTDRAAIE